MSEMTLPEGWESTTLDSLLTHVIGGDWGQEALYEASDFESVYCIRGSEFKNWKKELGSTAVRRKVKKSSLQTRALQSNDILVEISGGGPDQPVGRTVLITDQVLPQFDLPVVCTNFLRLARPSVNISATYLSHYLANFYVSGEVINYQGGSNNLRNLKFKEYSSIAIPLPPLAEQKVIADQLDTLLAQVERTKARLERVPDILKQFRQSVLAAAVSGKLTEGWREENSKYALSLDNYNHSLDGFKVKAKGLNEVTEHGSWLSCQLGHVISVKSGDGLTAKEMNEGGNVPVYGGNGINGYHDIGNVVEPTVVIGRVGFYCGAVHLTEPAAWVTDNALIVSFSEIILNKSFVFLLLKSTNLREDAASSAQPVISGAKIYPIELKIPPIEEQTEIVRRVETLFTHADKIEQQAQAGLARVNQLTQSILAKAFRGELTAQWRKDNSELISGENSAEALLERIRAEKAAMGGKKRSTKNA